MDPLAPRNPLEAWQRTWDDAWQRRPLLPLALLAVGAARIGNALAGHPLAWATGCLVLWALGCWRGRALVAAWVALVSALGLLDACRSPVDGRTAAVRASHEEPLHGTWRSLGPRSGRLCGSGTPLTLELDVPPPPEGTEVVLLPGEEPMPWPRGPVPGARSRKRTGPLRRVRADEWVVAWNAPPAREGALRAAIRARLRAAESPGRARGLLQALVLGDRAELSPELVGLFTRTGVRHLLAVSGLHVALFAALLLVPLVRLLRGLLVRAGLGQRAGRPGRAGLALELALRLALLGGYVVLVGAGEPVTRAACALGLAWAGELFARDGDERCSAFRRADGLSVWSLALLFEVLSAPAGLERLSLQLSYAATLGLLLGTAPLAAGLARCWRPRPGWNEARLAPLASAPRALAAACVARTLRAARWALAASACAMLATLPWVATHFGELAPASLLTTPASVPFVGALLALSWLEVVLPGEPLAPLLRGTAEAWVRLLEAGDTLPGTPWLLPLRPVGLTALLVLGTFGLLRTRSPSLGRIVPLGWALWLLPWSAAPAGLELFALDVGHGNATVLRAPGIPALVFDAGSRDRTRLREEALSPLLRAWEVDRVVIGLSHDHEDHAAVLPELLERVSVPLWLGALPQQAAVRSVHDRAGPSPARHLDLDRGRARVHLPGPLRLTLVRGRPVDGNEGSRMLELGWRGERLLLTGDAEGPGLEAALAENWLPGPLRLLVAPHHGSDFAALGAALDRWKPEEIWISASSRPAIAEELERRRCRWRWTGRDGPLALRLP